LEIRRGIFWRREITIPRARVQHTDVRQGPLQRQYGVAKLVIHTAGTEAASIELNGLSLPIAKWLRDALIGELKGKSDAV
jgi:membrane protein YdbS with pleckstrin-like domain